VSRLQHTATRKKLVLILAHWYTVPVSVVEDSSLCRCILHSSNVTLLRLHKRAAAVLTSKGRIDADATKTAWCYYWRRAAPARVMYVCTSQTGRTAVCIGSTWRRTTHGGPLTTRISTEGFLAEHRPCEETLGRLECSPQLSWGIINVRCRRQICS